MKTKSVIFSFLMLCVGTLSAQDFLFKVTASKGGNQINSKGSWTALESGKRVYTGGKIKVVSGGYISMIHNSGKPMELKAPGTYDAQELAKKFDQKSSGFASRYSNFVLAGMDNTGGTGNANMTGAAHRGPLESSDSDVNLELYSINIEGFDGNHILKSEPSLIKWDVDESGESDSYTIQLLDLEEQVVFTNEVSTNEAVLDFTSVSLPDQAYLLVVVGKDNDKAKSKRALLKMLSKDDAKKAEEDLSKLKAELDLTAAIDNLVMASYYEEKSMYLNAVACYEKALEIAPGVESYEKAYNNYLIRIGVKEEEKK